MAWRHFQQIQETNTAIGARPAKSRKKKIGAAGSNRRTPVADGGTGDCKSLHLFPVSPPPAEGPRHPDRKTWERGSGICNPRFRVADEEGDKDVPPPNPLLFP